jgi:hypothetical protein
MVRRVWECPYLTTTMLKGECMNMENSCVDQEIDSVPDIRINGLRIPNSMNLGDLIYVVI